MKNLVKMMIAFAACTVCIHTAAQSNGGYGYGTSQPNIPNQGNNAPGIPIPAGTGTNTGTPATPPNSKEINQQVGTTIPVRTDSLYRGGRKNYTGNDTIGTNGSRLSRNLNRNLTPPPDTAHNINRNSFSLPTDSGKRK